MFLQSLEIVGFKSFAQKTILTFHPGVTAIVGPNGCGKSNVLDSLRWVLGEQSAKALRGGEMADVIFSGTDSRPPLGMAEVSLTFADCEKELGLEYNEVRITRRVFRDGQSEYLLNKVPCRLRDIQQMFMDTGVGRSAYSIMEQGKIDQILSSRPEDRRAIFEEAAGITKYKSQKKEALRKLEATEANLIRVTDIIREVKRQIGSLQRQAGKARRYQALVADVRILDTHSSRRKFDNLESQRQAVRDEVVQLRDTQELRERDVAEQEERVGSQRAELEAMEQKLTAARQVVNEFQNRISQGENRIESNRERIVEATALVERYARDVASAEEKLVGQQHQIEEADHELEGIHAGLLTGQAQLDEQLATAAGLVRQRSDAEKQHQEIFARITKIEGRLSSLRGEISASISARDGADARMEILREEIEKATAARQSIEAEYGTLGERLGREVQTLEERNRALAEAESAAMAMQQELSALDISLQAEGRKLAEKESKLDILQQLNAEGEGFGEGAQAVLRGLDNPEFFKPAIVGALAQFIEVDREWITAIEAALGQHLQAIVTKDSMVAEAMIKTLAGHKMGRASLALVDCGLRIADCGKEESALPEGAIAWAVDKVKSADKFEPLIRELLDGVVIVADVETAFRLASANPQSSIPNPQSFVTLAGETLSREGIVTGGTTGEAANSVLQRKTQIAELEREATELRASIARMTSRRDEGTDKLRSAQEVLQETRTATQAATLNVSQLRGEISLLDRGLTDSKKKAEALGWERDSIQKRHDEAVARLATLEEEAASSTAAITDSQNQQTNLQEQLGALRENESALNNQLNELRIRVATERQRHQSLQSQRQPMALRLAELRETIDQRRRDIEDYQARAAALEEESENLQCGIEQARGRFAEAELAVNALLEERGAMISTVEAIDGALRRMRHELSDAHDRRGQLEVKATQYELHLENLCEHVQRRYQIDLREFQNESFTLLTTVRDLSKKQRKLDVDSEGDPEPEKSAAPVEETAVTPVATSETIDWDRIEAMLKELDQKLDAMGPINMDAIQEYDELEQRYTFLEQQFNDLTNSKGELLDVITKINTTTRKLFADTFEQVRVNFQEMFGELFGGGKANLILLDESDPLESGIEIIAKPPGKQLQSISLLSGGEKTMTAVALLFSIYMVKPSPFCVLDEMDAPLDESNINRFIKILDRFVHQSQFVVITHNKRTIAKADVLYGVTMEEHGVSKLVGVKFSKREDSGEVNDIMGTSNPAPIPSVAETFGKHGQLHSERLQAV